MLRGRVGHGRQTPVVAELVKLRLRSTAITAADLAFLVGALPRLAELDLGPGLENQVTDALARRA